MNTKVLYVPKKLRQVELWVHPEGRVVGSVYLRQQSDEEAGEEWPEQVLNRTEPFIALKCDEPDELRFYSKRSIVRLQYHGRSPAASGELVTMACRLYMMDGSILSGEIRECLLPTHRRLFDYINHRSETFVRLYLEAGDICLINKTYIVRVCSDAGATA